ncbi:hypothetical protein UPYG_G00152050 [Umbra pygmaea]|uniref:C2H2-type domain-containing protein n=1 Tax=Umbra pygmaea TaxID=75934 RepID=A0ABD0WX71_UMBPY
MSDFTIDIQLTELGFPDILQPRESMCVKETPLSSASNNSSISSASLANLQTPSPSPEPLAANPTFMGPEPVTVDPLVSVASQTPSTQKVVSLTCPHITVTPIPSGPSQTLKILCPPLPSQHKPVAVTHTSCPVTSTVTESSVSGQSNGLQETPKIAKTVRISMSHVGSGTVLTSIPASSTDICPSTSLPAPVTPNIEHLITSKDDSKLSPVDGTNSQITDPVKTIRVVSDEAEEDNRGEVSEGSTEIEEKDVCNEVDGDDGKEKDKQGLNTLVEDSEETDDSEVSELDDEEDEDDDEDDEDDEELGPEAESGGSGEHHCTVCGLVLFSSFQLQEHMNLHTGARPYCCDECGKRFCQLANYRSHLRTHAQPQTPGPVVKHSCRICLKGFDSQEGLKNHLAKSHLEKEFYECDVCKRIFTCRAKCEEHLEEHKRKLAGHVCLQCGRSFRLRRSLRRHKEQGCVRSYRCIDCPLSFSRKNTLLRHSFSHLGLLPYTCVQCRRHFRLAKLYRKHECDPKRIHCVACLGVFHSHGDFQKHKKETGCWGHQGTKGDEIRCMECGEAFSSAEELKKHAGAHQRVMTCSECGKGFRSALMLMSHMGGHAGSRPCLCQNCGLGFPHQQGYESHLKDCGRKPPPVMAPKKTRKEVAVAQSPRVIAPRIPIPALKKPGRAVLRTPDSSPTGVSLGVPAPTPLIMSGLAPVTSPVRADVSNSSAVLGPVQPSKGLWKLSLDKEPPPGVSLVMFVPANTSLASGLSGSSSTQPHLPETQTQWKVLNPAPNPTAPPLNLVQSSLPSEPIPMTGENRPYSLNSPLDLVIKTGNYKPEPAYILPLDLSKKSTSSTPIDLLAFKTEPTDSGFSETTKGVFTGSSGDKKTDGREDGAAQSQVQKACGVPSTLQRLTNVKQTKPLKGNAEMDSVSQLKIELVSSLHCEMPVGLVQIKQEPMSPDADSRAQSSDLWLPGPLSALKREAETDVGLDLRWDGGTPGCVLDLRLKGENTASVNVSEKAQETTVQLDEPGDGNSFEMNPEVVDLKSRADQDRLEANKGAEDGTEENKGGEETQNVEDVHLCTTCGNVLPVGEDEAQHYRMHTEQPDEPVVEPTHSPETQRTSSTVPSPSASPPCKRRRSLRTREKPRALNDCLL